MEKEMTRYTFILNKSRLAECARKVGGCCRADMCGCNDRDDFFAHSAVAGMAGDRH